MPPRMSRSGSRRLAFGAADRAQHAAGAGDRQDSRHWGRMQFSEKDPQWVGQLVNANPWRLSPALAATNLPLRYAFAIGGQCKIEEGPSAAHESSDTNPCGRGIVRRWYLDATRITAFAAPQIHARGAPLTAEQFWQGANGAALPRRSAWAALWQPGWLPRRALAGTFEEKATGTRTRCRACPTISISPGTTARRATSNARIWAAWRNSRCSICATRTIHLRRSTQKIIRCCALRCRATSCS